jgi:hypothetical protein
MKLVRRWSEVPAFASEREEHEFWSTHGLAGEALEQLREDGDPDLPPPSAFQRANSRTRPAVVRLEPEVLRRLKALAARKHKDYQTLLREFVVERLSEEEEREGLIPT